MRAVLVILFTFLGFFLGVITALQIPNFKSPRLSRQHTPQTTAPPLPDVMDEPKSSSATRPPERTAAPFDFSVEKEATPADFAARCLAAAEADPEGFAKTLSAQAPGLRLEELETAVWALSRHRPELGADVTAGMKSPWLSRKLAQTIAAGVPVGDDVLRKDVETRLKLPASVRQSLGDAAMADQAESDEAWAALRLQQASSPMEKLAILKGLARSDPADALAKAKSAGLPPADMTSLLGEVARTDPAKALGLVDNLEKPAGAAFLYFLLNNGGNPITADELQILLPKVDQYGDTAVAGPYYGGALIAGAVQTLLSTDPARAAELYNSVPENQRSLLLPSVALAMNDQNWTKAMEWVQATQSDATESPDRLFGMLPYQWATSDPENLQRALLQEKNLPGREQLFAALQSAYQIKGATAYQRWLKQLPQALKTLVK